MDKIPFIQDSNDVEHVAGIKDEFPYTMHRRELTNGIIPWHWHEEVEFNYIDRGTIEIETFDHTYLVKQGEAYFINTNVMDKKQKAPHSSMTIEHAHLFDPVLLSGYYHSIYATKYLDPILNNRSIDVLIIKDTNPTGQKFIQLLKKLTKLSDQPNQEFQIRNLLSELWLVLIQEIHFQEQQHRLKISNRERSKNILAYLHHHYAEKITIQDIANYVNVSPKECIRDFKRDFHQTPIKYLLGYRIEKAREMLRNTKKPITDIAMQTGFNSSAYFGKTFKEQVGEAPSEYREKYDND